MKIKAMAKAVTLGVATLAVSANTLATPTVEELAQRLEQMQQEIEQLKSELANTTSLQEVAVTKQELAVEKKDVAKSSEWRQPDTLIHMAGYADVGYTNGDGQDGSYNVGTFSPIFHYQIRDVVMMGAELEVKVKDDGSTEVGMEYMTIDWFMNDYVALAAGKFLSPIGQFRQNLHPSWINKIVSPPPGFGHDGAAPTSDVGFQLRGGFPILGMRSNYAVYASNGPELISTVDEHGEAELEGIAAEGFGADRDGEKTYGGRFGLIPFPGLEIGLSLAGGKATVTEIEEGAGGHSIGAENPETRDPDAGGELNEKARDYDVLDIDFHWQLRNFALRGEYVETEIGDDSSHGITASDSATWEAWYTQGSYRFGETKYEVVARYAEFDAPEDSADQDQWALGVNYLFTSNFIAKFTYEFNDGESGAKSNDDRYMFQLAYGF